MGPHRVSRFLLVLLVTVAFVGVGGAMGDTHEGTRGQE